MKKLSIFLIIILGIFIFYGCKKEISDDIDVDFGNKSAKDNIKIENLGLVNGHSILKITNDNYNDIRVKINIKLTNKENNNEYIKNILASSTDYLIFKNENDDSFLYDFYIVNEKDNKYFEIINSIKFTYAESKDNLVLTVDNSYERDIIIEALVLFFNNGKLVDFDIMLLPKINKGNIKNVIINKSKDKYDLVEIRINDIKSKY